MLAEQVPLVADRHVQRPAVFTLVALLLMGQTHPELPVTKPERERELVPVTRQAGSEGQVAVEVAYATAPEDQRRPHNDQLPNGPGC
jgi:hypothetical protein